MGQEPEGIDWWDRDRDGNTHYLGQLHAILLDNDANDDAIWFKHYRVDYWCVVDEDTDGDGIKDGDEVYELGTSPLFADTDGDGVSDFEDEFPTDPAKAGSGVIPGPQCGNGFDDDGDGHVDYPDDPSCAHSSDQSEAWFLRCYGPCNDGVDNDGDGLIDLAYPRCLDPCSSTEVGVCQDCLDNDGDGLVDDPEDPGCASAASMREDPDCNDGVDNDGDGLVDLRAAAGSSTPVSSRRG